MPELNQTELHRFHPLISRWFGEKFGNPTEIQTKAWEVIASGEHCLISAATGSGKTLAAFLWGISQLASGEWKLGQTRLLYISPLKALNNDIQRNLLTPLAELREAFRATGEAWPEVRVMTRSGDTEQADRRKMLRHPPEILITTPESLNLLLTSKDGQRALLGVKSVILDEIHSVVGSKRGVYLMTGIERLAHLTGEFQRIALSATVRPMDTVAAFVGGFLKGQARQVKLAQSSAEKRYEIEVNFPDEARVEGKGEDFWQPVVEDLKRLIAKNKSTLIFVNSRMLSEKIAHRINLGEESPIAYSHHGSLSREIRFAVEQRLKNGELKAIVATNSLEMGIDVGALDCVVMVQSPNAISSAIQKVGRAGHQVGAVSKAVVFPSHSRDFLEAAVLSQAIQDKDIEEVHPVKAPLDVLAQVIVSTLGTGAWDLDELFALIRGSYPFRDLRRDAYDLVVEMLAGRYAGSRLRELKPRISIDRGENTATLRKGALMAFYFSGGVIPDRGYFHMRMSGSGGRVGELDEEFVWEQKIGDVFTLGVQSWKIESITYNDVFVVPAASGEMAPPFWRAERYDRDFHFSQRIGEFLEWANARLDESGFEAELGRRFALNAKASEELAAFLKRQKASTRQDLPHRHQILAELIDAAPGGAPGKQLVLHTHWGGQVNRPYALALDAAWFEAFGHRTDVYVNNDCVVIILSEEVRVEEVLRLVSVGNVDTWLRKRLEGSGFFGARFREAAGISLLITRNKAGQRLPLWMSRMRAKKLFESVHRYDDFPLLLEAWRTCLKDEFDMESLRLVLGELESGEIAVSFSHSAVASPFASDVAWRLINDEYMYANDDPAGSGDSRLREDLVKSIAFDEANRPRVPKIVIQDFEAKRQRRAEGYAPSDSLELKEWLRDQIALKAVDWESFCAIFPDSEIAIATLELGGNAWVFLEEERVRVESLFSKQPDLALLLEWLSFYGPVSVDWLRTIFGGVEAASWLALLDGLEDERRIVRGVLVEGDDSEQLCEAENFETLLRMNRARNRPNFEPLVVGKLALFLADWQGVAKRGEGVDAVRAGIDRCLGWVAGVDDWEKQVLSARVENYHEGLLDSVLVEDGAIWFGRGEGRVGFCLEEDLGLLGRYDDVEGELDLQLIEILDTGARYSFGKLQELMNCGAGELESALWGLVWSGRVSNDAFAAARRGARGKFEICKSAVSIEPSVRALRFGRRMRTGRAVTYPGNWYALPESEGAGDAMDRMEDERERARILLDRYGIVFRELLERETKSLQWRDVFKALRLLELSGEAIGGRFFEGVPGLQFVSLEGLRRLRKELPERAIYWLGATDPASVCGLGLESLKGSLPKRLVGSRLVYRGSELVAESHRGGKGLNLHVKVSDSDLSQILDTLGEALGIGSGSHSQLKLEEINGTDARCSEYLESLGAAWRLHCDHKQVVVEGNRQ